jgi:hypothetical protein
MPPRRVALSVWLLSSTRVGKEGEEQGRRVQLETSTSGLWATVAGRSPSAVGGGGGRQVLRVSCWVELGGVGLGLRGGRTEEDDGHDRRGATMGCGWWPLVGQRRRREVVEVGG